MNKRVCSVTLSFTSSVLGSSLFVWCRSDGCEEQEGYHLHSYIIWIGNGTCGDYVNTY